MRPQLSQKIADKLVERIVKEIELGNTLLNYEIDPLGNENNTLYRDHKEVSDKLHIILKSVTDGSNIVQRMQEFTRREQDKIIFEPIDIGELIEHVITFTIPRWKSAALAKGIKYHLDNVGMEKVPWVMGDGTKLREVMLNIINNFLDAKPEGGRISFDTRKKNGNVFLSISDTGHGMPKDVQRQIFYPFFTTKMPK